MSDDQGLGLKSWLTGPRKSKPQTEGPAQKSVLLDRHRVAVLPFTNMSPDPADEYFADGMTEELITTMSKIDQFEVISRTSIMQFKKNPKPIKEVSRELDAGTVLEGSVRKSEGNVRVTVQMIDPTKDRHVWAESYDRPLKDVFAIQSEISKTVAEELKIRILPGEKKKLEKQPTDSMEAYTLYLKGRYQLNQRTREGFNKSIQYFTEATVKDPGFARAYVGLSQAYGILENWGYVKTEAAIARTTAYVAKALELDSSLGETHVELASILASREYKITEAEQEMRHAIQLDPNSSIARQRLSFTILGPQGRHKEALSEMREAARLDPLSPIIASNIGDEYMIADEYAEAEKEYRRVIEKAPRFAYAHSQLGLTLLKQARYDEAISEITKAKELSENNPSIETNLIYAYWTVGRKEDAERLLKELENRSRQEFISNITLALAYAGTNRKEKALEMLEKAVAERSNQVRVNLQEVQFDELRSHPRFQKILATVRIKQAKD